MKKILAIILSAMIVCAASGCASNSTASDKDATQAATTAAETIPEATAATADPAVSKDMEQTIEQNEFEGVVYAVENGKPVASYAKGTLENGKEITLDSPMPLGSVSKQFCAAAIMLLRDQGKLCVSDTLDKYYPDYAKGKKLSLHNLLSMRSGIPELTEENSGVVKDNATEEENVASIKKWLFSQPLMFEPDSEFVYTNTNFFLLADIVEQVSGKKYVDFLRENFFEPLGMTHTGSIIELDSSPSWAQGNIYKQIDTQPGLTKGAGDLISNAADVTAWINALSSGKVISAEAYKAMITDYSPEEHYGYGLYLQLEGGVGHYGAIQIYSAFDYVNTDKKQTLVVLSNSVYPPSIAGLAADFLTDLNA